jgi:hypothetical protein
MARQEAEQGYAALVRAFLDGDPREHEGGPFDVRAVMACLPQATKDAFEYDGVPWDRFSRGHETQAKLEQLRAGDPEFARHALRCLQGELANSARSACALAVPFLLRIGADPRTHFRADILVLAAEIGRQTTGPGLCTREELLRVAYDDDEWVIEPSGYPGHWSIQAAREAVTADADLVIELLADSDPQVRSAAAYTAVVALGRTADIKDALSVRMNVEKDPAVRAGLVFASAQLAREHGDADGEVWTQLMWSDLDASPEMRVSAALGWMCLTDAPIPDTLRIVLDQCATDATGKLMGSLPWMRAVDYRGDPGLQICVRMMLSPEAHDLA